MYSKHDNMHTNGMFYTLIYIKNHIITDGYYVAYKPITFLYILFMFIEMKSIHCHSCVMFAMKSMSMCNIVITSL